MTSRTNALRWPVLWLLLTWVLSSSSCSLFGDYSPEGLPCDPGAAPGQECLPDAGYVCARVDGGAFCVTAK